MALAPRTLLSPESPLAVTGAGPAAGATAPASEHASGERALGALSERGGPPATFRTGEVVAARWRIDGLLGVGGMGEVYEAFDLDLAQPVALKTLRSDRDGVPRAVLGLKREVHLARRVTHPAACRVFDFGVHEDGDRNVAFLVMELLDGEPLSARLGREGPLDAAALRGLALDLADALAAAHRVQVVHRDLKPGNVMLVRTGGAAGVGRRAVVTDFGVARLTEELAQGDAAALEPSTATTFAGTPLYMAPEQLRGERATAKSDVYAFGLVLLEAATAQHPEGASSLPRLLRQRQEGHRRESLLSLPPWLVAVVRVCLATSPADRYADGAALGEALRRALPERVRERRRARLLGAAGAVLALAAGAYGIVAQRARSAAESDARAARHFGEEVAQVEAVVRHSAMMPLHDVRGERAQVGRHLRAIEAEIPTLRPVPAAAARLALVRGGIALGDLALARRHADALWNAGERSPDLRLARGRVLAEQYRQERAAVSALAEPAYRVRRLAELDAELRTPALELLRSAQQEGDAPALAAALVAAYEGRREDANGAAEAVLAGAPWMVEAARLEGEMLLAEAEDARARENVSGALALLEKAAAPFERAIRLAESDGATHLGECDRATLTQETLLDLARVAAAPRDAAIAACERALSVDPEAVPSLLATVRALLLGPWVDPREPRFERAVTLAERAVALAPDDARTHAALSDAHSLRACFEHGEGRDPRPADDAAQAAFEEALRRGPDALLHGGLRGDAASARAEYETQQGLDPRPATRRLLAAAERGLERLPDAYALHDLVARLYRAIALYDGAHDTIPTASYEQALAHFEWMAKAGPSMPTGPLNVCFTANHLAYFLVKVGEDPTPVVARAKDGCTAAAAGDPNAAHTVHADLMLAQYRHERTEGRSGDEALAEAREHIDQAVSALATDPDSNYGDTVRKLIAVQVAILESTPLEQGRKAYLRAHEVLDHGLPPTHEKRPALPEQSLLERAWVEALAKQGLPLDAAVARALVVADRAIAERPYSPRVHFSQGRIFLAWAEAAGKGPRRRQRAEQALRYFERSLAQDHHGQRQVQPYVDRTRSLLQD